jgi:predicted PilT family ATPase
VDRHARSVAVHGRPVLAVHLLRAEVRRIRWGSRRRGPRPLLAVAKGSAKFKSTAEERELQVEVEHVRRLAGKRVVFFVGGKKLASAKVNRFGAAEINRNSERGQFVPNVRGGTTVRVKTAAGALIVKRSF